MVSGLMRLTAVQGFILDKKIGVGQAKRMEDAKVPPDSCIVILRHLHACLELATKRSNHREAGRALRHMHYPCSTCCVSGVVCAGGTVSCSLHSVVFASLQAFSIELCSAKC